MGGKSLLIYLCIDKHSLLTNLQQHKKTMGDKFEMHNAFSREGPKKVYVQHLLKEQGKMVNDLLEQKAYFYVCGDAANMAREVNAVLVQIIAEHRGKTEAKAEEIVKNMRAANQYQVRPSLHHLHPKARKDKRNSDISDRRTFGHRREFAFQGLICCEAKILAETTAICFCALAVRDTGVLGWHACN